jgi:NADH-quinone oxidoreductase subunit M
MPLLFLLFILLAGVALIMAKLPPKAIALTAALFCMAVSVSLLLFFQSDKTGYQIALDLPWNPLPFLPSIHLHVGVDGISLPLILLTTVVTVAAVAISPENIKRPAEFYICLLLISTGAIGAFISLDLFFFFIFHELALIPTFLLIGIWGGQNRQFASMQMTLYLTAGSLVVLAGLIGLVMSMPAGSRSFDLPTVQQYLRENPLNRENQQQLYALLLVGFGVLVSLFPFHSWAAPGYAAAPPAAAMLHAGILKKFGLYGLLRVGLPLLPLGAMGQKAQYVLLVMLLGNILYVGLVALAQKELQTLLGFSSVMHMGYLFLGLLSLNSIGLSGVILLMVAHGLSTALLFGLAGEIQARTGENRFSELGGLARRTPFLATAFIFGTFAAIGVPGLANFTGDLLIFFGAWTRYPDTTALALWGVVLSAVYMLRAVNRIFYGDLPERYQQVEDIKGFANQAPYVLLMTALLVLGFMPGILLQIVQPSVKALLTQM